MAAVYFKYAADKGDGTAMIEYGNFLQCVIEHKIEKIKINEYVQKTKNITKNIDIFNNYLYVEQRYVFDTIYDESAAIYVCFKYLKKASKLGMNEASKAIEKLLENHMIVDCPSKYYEELCKPIFFPKLG